MINLVVLTDHVVFQLAIRGQNADFTQQRSSVIHANQILPSRVEQGIGGRRFLLRCRLPLGLLHLHTARRDRKRHYRSALGVSQYCFIKFLRLFDKKRAEVIRIHRAFCALKAQPIVLAVTRQFRFKLFLSRSECADRLHKKIPVFGQSRRNTAEQQLEFCRFSLLHFISQPLRMLSYHISPPFGKPLLHRTTKTAASSGSRLSFV